MPDVYWTRARVLDGLRRLHADHAVITTGSAEHDRYALNNRVPGRRLTRYPSAGQVLRYWPTLRQGWAAAGFDVDNSEEAYSSLDDWFIREAIGIFSREQIAAELKRTPQAIHRRIYDLGLNSYERHGWTPHRVERIVQVTRSTIETYLDRGDIPYLRGYKALFMDPADLLVIDEIDWQHPPAELELDIRRSLAARLMALLSGQDWRAGRPYAVHKLTKTARRWRQRLIAPGPRPLEVSRGDLVRVAVDVPSRPGAYGRAGIVHLVYWARNSMPSRHAPPAPAAAGQGKLRVVATYKRWPAGAAASPRAIYAHTEPCWMARVEFKKVHNRGQGKRVTYSLPLTALELVQPEKLAS